MPCSVVTMSSNGGGDSEKGEESQLHFERGTENRASVMTVVAEVQEEYNTAKLE